MSKAHLTAIARKAISAPAQWLLKQGLIKSGHGLDYGCGRGFDADELGFDKYDPHYVPEYPSGEYEQVICFYVVNVIEDSKERIELLNNIKDLLTSTGAAYIAIRRDVKKPGLTSRGTWQDNVVLPLKSIRKTSTYEIYELKKEEVK